MRSGRRDEGALQLAWMVKLVAVLAVLGVFGFDGFAIMSAKIKGEDDAQDAATAASAAWQTSHNIQNAYQAAQQYVADKNEKVLPTDFRVDADNTVHLLLRKPIQTIVFKHIGPLKKYTVQTLHGDANSNPP